MKKLIAVLTLTVLCMAFFGCASSYTIVMKDGTELHSDGAPDFNERTGFYDFQDSDGKNHHVNKDEIRNMREDD